MKRKKYEKLIEPMQAELVAMARWIDATGQRLVVLFEGRDTAGWCQGRFFNLPGRLTY